MLQKTNSMIIRLFEKYMQDIGYEISLTEYPEIKEYIKDENSCVNILQVVDANSQSGLDHPMLKKQTLNICQTVHGKDVHVMNLIFFDNEDKARDIAGDEYMCWLIDKLNYQLVIPKDRVEDFYGLKGILENWLSETGYLLDSGDMHAINEKLMTNDEREAYLKKSSKKPAPVAVTLVIVNTLVFLTSVIIGNIAANGENPFIASGRMEFDPVINGEYYRFISAMFLHSGVQHLISNMVLLYFMGEMVENKTGSVRFAIIYLVSGIMGNVVSFGYEWITYTRYTSVGASGAVYGIMGALLYLVIKKTEGLNIPIKRMILLVAYCLYSSFASSHIDYAAHIGGLVFGFIMAFIVCAKELSKKGGGT